jgi:integrative and conjugative element protein (TIGR02256 family)
MKFNRVILMPKCLSVIKKESRKTWFLETGGPLVGYISQDNALILTDATGPGPRAILQCFSVTIDGAYAQKFCDKIMRESDGQIDYVGDWHKHPGTSLRPSGDDIAAMKTMANFQHSPTKNPISLIYRRWPQCWQVYVWDGSGSLLKISSEMGQRSRANAFSPK